MDFTFIYRASHKYSGSVYMRVTQVAGFLRDKGVDVKCIPNTDDYLKIKKSVIVFSKHLGDIDVEHIWELKKNNCICLYDPVDAKVDISNLKKFDAILCASFRQLHVLSFKGIPVIPFLHHHDPRIRFCKKNKRKDIGYFGENANIDFTALGEIKELTDVIGINTKNVDKNADWIPRTGDYAFHLVERKYRDIDGFKPFTKGFNAAAAGAIPLLRKPKTTSDAHICLGDNYPFYIPDSLDLKSKECILDFLYGERSCIEDVKIHLNQMREYSTLNSTTKYLIKCNEYL